MALEPCDWATFDQLTILREWQGGLRPFSNVIRKLGTLDALELQATILRLGGELPTKLRPADEQAAENAMRLLGLVGQANAASSVGTDDAEAKFRHLSALPNLLILDGNTLALMAAGNVLDLLNLFPKPIQLSHIAFLEAGRIANFRQLDQLKQEMSGRHSEGQSKLFAFERGEHGRIFALEITDRDCEMGIWDRFDQTGVWDRHIQTRIDVISEVRPLDAAVRLREQCQDGTVLAIKAQDLNRPFLVVTDRLNDERGEVIKSGPQAPVFGLKFPAFLRVLQLSGHLERAESVLEDIRDFCSDLAREQEEYLAEKLA